MFKLYRKEPVMTFLLTIGGVDAAIGGLSEHWSLMTVGLGMLGLSLGLKLGGIHQQHTKQQFSDKQKPRRHKPGYILPPTSSNQSLPMLSLPKKNPPSL